MLLTNALVRNFRYHIAAPCLWNGDPSRTFSCSVLLSKDHNDESQKNDDSASKGMSNDTKLSSEQKRLAGKRMYENIQRHIRRLQQVDLKNPENQDHKTIPKAKKLAWVPNTENSMKYKARKAAGQRQRENIEEHLKQIKGDHLTSPRMSPNFEKFMKKSHAEINTPSISDGARNRIQEHIKRIKTVSQTEKTDDQKAGTQGQQQEANRHADISMNKEAIEELHKLLDNAANISDSYEPSSEALSMETWNILKNHDLKMHATYYPRSALEEMIRWTEEGKMWKFPIDNEAGLEEEKDVHFSEHIFLDHHLEGWCPTVGPVRHFMELVCVGLSKNPYLSVREKVSHIMWYKQYFTSRTQLLENIGVWDVNSTPQIEESSEPIHEKHEQAA